MKKGLLIVTLGLFVIACWGTAQATTYSYLKNRGARVYVDTVRWSNNHGIGTGGLRDSLRGTSDKDTSSEFDIANLEAMSVMIIANEAGTSGTASCSLDVSLDGTNWSQEKGIVIWARASSIVNTTKALRVVYATDVDSAATDVDSTFSSPRGKAKIQAARLARLRTIAVTGGGVDSVYITAVVYRSFKPLGPR